MYYWIGLWNHTKESQDAAQRRWQTWRQQGGISVGYGDRLNSKELKGFRDLVGGDTVVVYAAEFGFLAAGVVTPTARPREVDEGETGLITGIGHHRNWIDVEWRFGHADVRQAIKVSTLRDFGISHPVKGVLKILEPSVVKKLLDSGLIPALSVSPGIAQPIVPAQSTKLMPDDEYRLQSIKTRRGQPDFRGRLLEAYGNQCQITKCRVIPLLEAAHITAHAEQTDYRLCNGLLLRADIHTLFDLNLLGIDAMYRIHVYPSLRESEYWCFNGRSLDRFPQRLADNPDRDGLDKRCKRLQ